MSSQVWKGQVYAFGKLYDVKLAIDFNVDKAGQHLARKAAASKRRTASMCFGSIHAEVLEMQEVIT